MKHEETDKGFRLTVSLGDVMVALEELKDIKRVALENPECNCEGFSERIQTAIDVMKIFIADHYADEVRYGMDRLKAVLEQISEIAGEMEEGKHEDQ